MSNLMQQLINQRYQSLCAQKTHLQKEADKLVQQLDDKLESIMGLDQNIDALNESVPLLLEVETQFHATQELLKPVQGKNVSPIKEHENDRSKK